MNEIENVSDQLLAFMEEINDNIKKMQEKNENLTYDKGLELAKIAIENQRNDILWRRGKELIGILEDLEDFLESK